LLSRDSTTVTYASGDPAGGATGPANISADGSTVAWVATNAEAQTRFLPGESPVSSQPYYLWRRWQEPSPVTRRITGLADPDDPACSQGEEVTQSPTATGPCYGPLSGQESDLASIAGTDPGLSADGYTVAFLAGSALRPNITKSSGLDVFLTSMRPGATRKASTRELTLGVKSGNPGSTPSIESLAFSGNGSTIAFTSSRDSFVLPEPTPVGTFRPLPTANDLYVIHLAEGTLERAVVNYEDGDPNGSVSVNPTISENGSTVAFTASASNLIFGDANVASDAFTATLDTPIGTAAPSAEVNAAQNGFSLSTIATPELGLRVRRGRDGGVTVLVETPGAGLLTAQALGTIATKTGRRTKKRKVILAHVSSRVRSEGTTTLVLNVASKYAKDLKRAGKLKTHVMIAFKPPPPGEVLSAEVSATFVSMAIGKNAARSSGTNEEKRG
jgi:Tol biopolymer transport system component